MQACTVVIEQDHIFAYLWDAPSKRSCCPRSLLILMRTTNRVKAATALSNMGISLFEKQCYQQSWVTLHDAVHLVCGDHMYQADVTAYLQEAYARQSRPDPHASKCPICLQVLSDNSDSTLSIQATSAAGAVTVLRVEALESNFDGAAEEDDDDCQVTMAVIVHNYAVASLFIALTDTAWESCNQQLLQNSLRCMLRCQEVIGAISCNAMLSSWNFMQKVYTLAVVSTQGMLMLLYHLGPADAKDQVDQLHKKLADLRETLARLPSDSRVIAAASA